MPEKIEELVRAALAAAQEAGDLSAFELDDCAIERPADTSHGEWTSTMALKSAKLAHCAPRRYALRLLRPRRPATFPHLNLTIALSSDRLTLLMASGPPPWP